MAPPYFKLMILSLCVGLFVDSTEGFIGNIINIAKLSIDVTKLAFNIYKFVDERNNAGDISNKKVLQDIKDVSAATKEDIIRSMWGLSRIEQIDDTVHSVNSLMKDLEKIVNATNLDIAKAYETDFKDHYKHNAITTKGRTLSRLLTYKSPGNDFILLSHITETTRCNLTALAEFSDFYLNLMSEVIALHVMYDKLTKGLTPEQVIQDEWEGVLQDIQTDLSRAEQGCVDEFWSLATADLHRSTSAISLGKSNAERYIYNWTDVMFYAAVGTYQFHYLKFIEGRLIFQKTDQQHKIAVIGYRDEHTTMHETLMAHLKTNLRGTVFPIPSHDNKAAAKIVGEAVEKHINGLNYSVDAIVVYFDGEDFNEQGTFIDTDSTVISYNMSGVHLTYCFDADHVCRVKGREQGHDDGRDPSAAGSFKVYVYPSTKRPANQVYITGGSRHLTPGTATVVFVIFVCLLNCIC